MVAIVHATKSVVVRRYRQPTAAKPNVAVLMPENDDFPVIKLESAKSGYILGRVVGMWVEL